MPVLATFGSKVPVTVITGFLGSGKSTLLNHLLSQARPAELNVSVIENEFGEVNIDKELVADQLAEQEDLVSMEKGCVCCSLRADLTRAFSELLKRSKTRDKPMDHILLETTGLADPSPVAFTFFANPWIASHFQLDSIVCVVDAKHLMQHLQDGNHPGEGAVNEAVQQIAFADLVLLNKVDLVSESDKADVLEAIRVINNTARIVECQLNDEHGRPSLLDVLGTNTFSVQRALTVDPCFLDSDTDSPFPSSTAEAVQQCKTVPAASVDTQGTATGAAAGAEVAAGAEAAQGSKQAHVHNHDLLQPEGPCAVGQKREYEDAEETQVEKNPKRRRKKLHDLSDISSVGITTRGKLDEWRFNGFMRDLLSEKAKDIFRCKGILAVHGYPGKKFVFQGVHETLCYGPAEKGWAEGEPRINQIVFIGRGLDRKMLGEGFRTCLWQPLPEGWEESQDPTTKKPFYWNRTTKEKRWIRPEAEGQASEEVVLHHASTQQLNWPKSAEAAGVLA